MDAIRSPHGRRPTAVAAFCFVVGAGVVLSAPDLVDAPVVWHENDRQNITQPDSRDPNLTRDAIESSFFRPMGRLFNPARAVRHVGSIFGGDHVPPAANVNSLDEAPNSSWFTNRIGLFPVGPVDAARGFRYALRGQLVFPKQYRLWAGDRRRSVFSAQHCVLVTCSNGERS